MVNGKLIKVCGMRDADNIRSVETLGVDMMGFIFWPRSSRFVSERPGYLPVTAKRVGVFVDEDIDAVYRTVADYHLDIVQLHGSETPAYCRRLRSLLPVIKAFSVSSADDLRQTVAYEGAADYFLFDAKGRSAGGNGVKYDWTILDDYAGSTPFLLSGGIGPDDAEAVAAFTHPRCIGIDLNSRFETAPGLKDVEALRAIIRDLQEQKTISMNNIG